MKGSLRRIRTAVLISGFGSNLQALLDAAAAPDFPAEITLVLSNSKDAYGLKRAEAANVPAAVIVHKDYPNRAAFDTAMEDVLRRHSVELICLAGFMRILSPEFVQRWEGRLINIHPSLLPKYKGLDTHRRVLEAKDKEHGCTVHWVTAELDAGPTILQAKLKVEASDSVDSLTSRVHELEHKLYPQALKRVASALAKALD